MSKLDGNERWKSKMLLTEHQEQYEARNNPKKQGHPTPEELTMVRDYVLLPHMLTMIQKSIDDIRNTPNLLNRLYMTAAQVLMNKISQDMYDLKRELSRRNIKVLNDEQIDLVVYYNYSCRGYKERFAIVREVARAEISVRLTQYLEELSKLMKSYR
ncbi:hypothetical protein SD70_12915 [Gordoniibacillus kamchatkensis]|uniref:Uncharacterized protein n=1 Tax=Gordoniibacillus kamchatkensis TaxID=1590651 RepID=A0ABR5AHH3_9BACL|nr:hypothetical protein [Paenibacillus sp. VKM B-2647]KIL40479.1 hypothetical protein SD70_12915 [Paenibacillus sp. VKM B-2647]